MTLGGRCRAGFVALAASVLALIAVPAHAAQDEQRPLAVVFVGGYGSDLAEATEHFAALRASVLERAPNAVLVQYSFTGSTFEGCSQTPMPYTRSDTAQELDQSKRLLLETLAALQEACSVERVAIVGHSLGGLLAFEALVESPEPGVSHLIAVDSPMGGVPERLVETCVDLGFCAEGAIADFLIARYPGAEAEIAARAAALLQAGVRVSAWGNENDCFYNVGLCAPIARLLLGSIDARETQWLGMPSAVRKQFPIDRSLAGIGPSHTAVLVLSAAELAAELVPL